MVKDVNQSRHMRANSGMPSFYNRLRLFEAGPLSNLNRLDASHTNSPMRSSSGHTVDQYAI